MQQPEPARPKHYLREWRLAKGMDQRELARRAHTHKSIISRIENDKHGLELELLLRLCHALEIIPGQLFQDPNRPSLDAITQSDSDEKVRRIAEIVASMRDGFRD